MNKMYMIRAGKKNYLFDQFKKKNIIAIGWSDLRDLTLVKNIGQLKTMLSDIYGYKPQTTNMNAGQISRFKEMKIDDYVVTYNSEERTYMIGKIESDYIYDSSFEFPNQRRVTWLKDDILRDKLSVDAKNSLGSIMTVFEIKDSAKSELLAELSIDTTVVTITPAGKEEEESEVSKEDPENNALEFTKDKVMRLQWDEMQELVAALLRSLGLKTKVSPKGPDGGIDIIASPDVFGLEDPCICVEIKHRQGKIGAPAIKSFIQSVKSGGKGLYVSTGGFSKDAHINAALANIPLTLIGIDELVELIISNYDNFDPEGRKLIPLKKIYWPA